MIPTHWKIRITIGHAVIYCSSSTEPVAHLDACGQVESLDWTPITTGQDLGDTLAFIRWNEVSALSWREGFPVEAKKEKPAKLSPVGMLRNFKRETFTYADIEEFLRNIYGIKPGGIKSIIGELIMSREIAKHPGTGLYSKTTPHNITP